MFTTEQEVANADLANTVFEKLNTDLSNRAVCELLQLPYRYKMTSGDKKLIIGLEMLKSLITSCLKIGQNRFLSIIFV